MAKKQYYTLNALKKQVPNFDIAILMSGKSTGKSYAVKCECIEHYMKNPYRNGIAYLRRYRDDLTDLKMKRYWADMVRNKDGVNMIAELTHQKYNDIKVARGEIYLVKWGKVEKRKRTGFDADGKAEYDIVEVDEIIDKSPTPFCTGFWLSARGYDGLASQSFPGMYDGIAIVEEFMAQMGSQLDTEPFYLQKILSTIFRDSEKAKCYLIGNRINRNTNVYAVQWGLNNVSRQKPGTIDTYKFTHYDEVLDKEVETIIAVESIKDNGSGNSLVFANRDSILGDNYDAKPATNVFRESLDDWENIYEICFDTSAGTHYIGKLIVNDDGAMLFHVSPFSNKRKVDRHISNVFSTDPFVSSNFDSRFRIETRIVELISQGKLCYSDNITASEFEIVLKNLGTIA